MDRVIVDGYLDQSIVTTLENCQPISNHLFGDARSKLENALTDGDLKDALGAIAALKAGVAAICCSSGKKAVKDAT